MTDVTLARRRLLVILGLIVAVGALLWPRGLGRQVESLRRDYVAQSHFRAALHKSQQQPLRREVVLRSLRRALRLAPERTRYAAQAGQLFLGLRAYREALPYLRSLPGDDLLGAISLGQCLVMTGEGEEAQRVLDAALARIGRERRAGTMPDALYALTVNNIAYAYAVSGRNLMEARELLRQVGNMAPLEPAFIDSQGWVEYRLGRFQEAAFFLERAVRQRLPAEDAEMYYHLGACYARLGKVQAARRALVRCLELDPSWAAARKELDQLRQVLPPPLLVQQPRQPGADGTSS